MNRASRTNSPFVGKKKSDEGKQLNKKREFDAQKKSDVGSSDDKNPSLQKKPTPAKKKPTPAKKEPTPASSSSEGQNEEKDKEKKSKLGANKELADNSPKNKNKRDRVSKNDIDEKNQGGEEQNPSRKKKQAERLSNLEDQKQVDNDKFVKANTRLKNRIEEWKQRNREDKKSDAETKRKKYANFLAKLQLHNANKQPALNALLMLWSHTAPPKIQEIQGKKKSHQGKDFVTGKNQQEYYRTGENWQRQLFKDDKKIYVFDPAAYDFYKTLNPGTTFTLEKYNADTGQKIEGNDDGATNIVLVGNLGNKGSRSRFTDSGYGSELNAYSALKILGKMDKLNQKETLKTARVTGGETGKEYLENATSAEFKQFIQELLGNQPSARLNTDHTSQILDHSRNTVEKFRDLGLENFNIVLLPPNQGQKEDQKEGKKFFPYPALILEPKGNANDKEAIEGMITKIVEKFNEKHKIQLYERNSFGFLYPTISNLDKSIRIWPGQVDPDLFYKLLSEVLEEIDKENDQGNSNDEKKAQNRPGSSNNYEHATLLATLDRSLEFIRQIYSQDTEFESSGEANWFHQRIISNIAKANAIRNNNDKVKNDNNNNVKTLDPQDFYLEVTQIIENLNEYGFGLIELQEIWKPNQEEFMDIVREAYKGSLPEGYKISGAKLAQSGMHAANIALNLRKDNKFVSGPTYFEVPSAKKLNSKLNKLKEKRPNEDVKNTLIYDPAYNFTHVEDLKKWKNRYIPGGDEKSTFTTVIADITNVKPNEIQSVIDQNEGAEKIFLFGSLSKHFQLGMDKFTLGLVLEIEEEKYNKKQSGEEKKSELDGQSFYMPEELLRYFITMQKAQLKKNDENSK